MKKNIKKLDWWMGYENGEAYYDTDLFELAVAPLGRGKFQATITGRGDWGDLYRKTYSSQAAAMKGCVAKAKRLMAKITEELEELG